MLLKDIRDYQILFLGLFLVLGIGTRDWTLRPELIGVVIATCLATQWILSSLTGKEQVANLRSALITSLGLSLLLRADHWTTMAIAAASAIASKFLFKFGRHLQNSNI
jgi:Na+-transporting NADH:ubiquinone oxidoreductase subunit NqrB